MRITKITANGRIFIPPDLRKKYNIKEGMKIAFIENGNKIELQPLNKDYFKSLIGITKTKGKALKSLLEDKNDEKKL